MVFRSPPVLALEPARTVIRGDDRPDRKIKKTSLTLAVEDKILTEIRKGAEFQGLSINSKINKILSRYSEFDKYAELHKPVLVPAKHFETLLNNFDENHFHDFFKAVILELMPCELFKKEVPLTLENLLRFIFAGTYLHADIFQHLTYYTDDEGYLCLIFRHFYGIKWSKLIANIFGEMIKITFKFNVLYTILPSSVVLKTLEKKSE